MLAEALLSLPEDAAITDLDTPFIECRGLVLSGGSIIRDAGAETVEFLFTNFLGGLNRAFRGNIGFDDPLLDSNDRISALVLSDIALPLLNICQDAERRIGHFGEPGSQFEHQISSRSDEIRFQIELIKRYVQSLN